MDEKLLLHILSNLLSNAIKYSPVNTAVIFSCTCEKETVIFEVKDEGIGIPPEDLERLFESFHRAKNVGDIPGTGLGLAIVHKSVQLHGGQITVKSEVGVGTTFRVSLPLYSPTSAS
jgi:signal transduction histidine kinase